MHKKASSLARALEKADRDIPKLDTAAFEDESTRPVPLALLRLFVEAGDPTLSMKIAVPDAPTEAGIPIDTDDKKIPD